MSTLDELLSEIDGSLDDILYLIANYDPSHHKIRDIADLGQKLLAEPDYYNLVWEDRLNAKVYNSFKKFCLMMEVYIEHNICYGFTINNTVHLDGESARQIRCKAIKYFMNNSSAGDLKSQTSKVVSTLSESINDSSDYDQCMAALMLNRYLIVIKNATRNMGMDQHANDAIIILTSSMSSNNYIKDYLTEILGGVKGRKALCTTLSTIR